MRRLLAFMLIAALAAPALAQDQPKLLKTIRIHEPAPGTPHLYVIDEDGTVRIDWPAVETLAVSKADPHRPAAGTIDAGDQGRDMEAGAMTGAKSGSR